jgi:prepilin-type N-terminal cleavage/methylation domain-containing protein
MKNPKKFVVRRGFSLIELAIVLVVIAVLLATLAVPLSAQVEQRRREETIRQLDTIKEAINGFAISRGRLPCPSRLADNGIESLDPVGGETVGSCLAYNGYLPAVTLGLSPVDSNGFAIDAWGGNTNRIRYAVKDVNVTLPLPTDCLATTNHAFTAKGGMRQLSMPCLAAYNDDTMSKTLLTVCSSNPAAAQPFCKTSKLTVSAPFVLISNGKNAPTGGAAGTDEAWNAAKSGDGTVFVSRPPSTAGASGGEFDDIVAWGSLNTLFSRMVAAGQLP